MLLKVQHLVLKPSNLSTPSTFMGSGTGPGPGGQSYGYEFNKFF